MFSRHKIHCMTVLNFMFNVHSHASMKISGRIKLIRELNTAIKLVLDLLTLEGWKPEFT